MALSKKNWHLDIWLRAEKIAIELKYRTKKMRGKKDGEYFFFKDYGAQDEGRYSFLKDIQRLERIVLGGKAKAGFAVLLTNDPLLWDQRRSRKKNPYDADFHIYEGRTVTGKLARSEQSKLKMKPIHLRDSYHLRWRNYSSFRYLSVPVPP